MAVCRFFLQGSCKFGDRCRNEHPAGGSGNNQPRNAFAQNNNQHRNNFQDNQSGNQSRQPPPNRFQSLDSRIEAPGGARGNARFGGNYVPPNRQNQPPAEQRGRGFQANQSGGRRNAHRPNQYELSERQMIQDLEDRPQWLMSCFGPGRNPAINLWGDAVEQSPEELRAFHYMSVANGTPPEQTFQVEGEMAATVNNHYQSALSDPIGAIDYIVAAENQHPNRHDELKHERSRHPLFSIDNYHKRRGVFEHIPRDNPNNRNGRNQNQNQNRNQGFGNQSQQANVRFQGAGGFSQQNNGFSQPQNAGFNQSQGNQFSGQPSGTGPGQPQFGTSNFGQPQQQSGFAQPQFGAPPAAQGAFGQPTQQQANAFSRAQDTPMDAPMSPMGGMATNGFGQINNAFQQPQTTQPFGQPQNNNNNGFGQSNGVFGTQPQNQAMNAPNAFGNQGTAFGGAPQQQNANPGAGFGNQPNAFPPNNPQPNGLGQPNLNGSGQPGLNGFGAQQTQEGALANGIGATPMQNPQMGAAQNLPTGSEVEKAYTEMMQNGAFANNIMPEVAPTAPFI